MSKTSTDKYHTSKKITLILIGSELLQGKTLDKNHGELSQWLFHHPWDLFQTLIIHDCKEHIQQALDQAWQSSDIVITSGGIGPTADDLTKGELAAFCHKALRPCPHAQKIVEQNYRNFSRVYDPHTLEYHISPEDFECLPNNSGLAPGLFYHDTDHAKVLCALPGVPWEFSAMLQEQLTPRLARIFPGPPPENHLSFKTWQLPEAKIFNQICPQLWQQLSQYGQVSSLPNAFGVDIGVILNDSEQKSEVVELMKSSPIGAYIWQIGHVDLEHHIRDLLEKSQKTFCFIESCTGGLCSDRMTNVAGISQFFRGSFITYSDQMKINLGVDPKTLHSYTAVSAPVAQEMAQAALEHSQADIAISTTGLAGPQGDGKQPVGTLFCGTAKKDDQVQNHHFTLRGNRLDLKKKFSQVALHLLREALK